jgi:hypothetical protein
MEKIGIPPGAAGWRLSPRGIVLDSLGHRVNFLPGYMLLLARQQIGNVMAVWSIVLRSFRNRFAVRITTLPSERMERE